MDHPRTFSTGGITVLDDYGVAWDEPTQHKIAILNADYILGKSNNLLNYWDKGYGAVFELSLLLVERALGLEDSRSVFFSIRCSGGQTRWGFLVDANRAVLTT